jgi:hypothetical protein
LLVLPRHGAQRAHHPSVGLWSAACRRYAGLVRRRVEDLHGFDTRTAVEFALTRISEAYRNGYDEIELKHGAADVRERPEEGRGKIKWALRELLESGRLDNLANRGASWPKESSMVIALQRNPRPRSEFWSPPPRRGRPVGR